MNHIFIACAHSHGAPLPELVEESRLIEKILAPLRERSLYAVESNRAANIDDIFSTFQQDHAIQIFHYCGHADGETLYLEEAGNIRGIAELFGLKRPDAATWNPLQFVFLNGCASYGQTKSLFNAGVAAVISTSRKIGDTDARIFAEQFYTTWAMEGKTLEDAFAAAQARLHTSSDKTSRAVDFANVPNEEDFNAAIPWGLYFHPELPEGHPIKKWALNKRLELPAFLLSEVKPGATQSLRELIFTFQKTDKEAQHQVRTERKDPLIVLIERLPWIIGTHLRRLFAVEAGATMTEPGIERLRELIAAYSGLTRFINYLSISLLWDARADGFEIEPLPFSLIPDESAFAATDFVFRTRVVFQQLTKLDNADPLELKKYIDNFIQLVDNEKELRPGYLLMEEWKQALAAGEERFAGLVASRSADKPDGIKSLVLVAEAIYARFLKACLFLTQYKLHTVRSIVVDKIRNLVEDRPYSHYTISLHAAFSQLQTSLTPRETATDNYCLLLTPRGQKEDALANAVNLSPFYLDRSSLIGSNTSNYPAVFALDFQRGSDFDREYVFHYIDTDVNHHYKFNQDNQLVIKPFGADLPEHIEVSHEDTERFQRIYEQLQQLEMDIPPES